MINEHEVHAFYFYSPPHVIVNNITIYSYFFQLEKNRN